MEGNERQVLTKHIYSIYNIKDEWLGFVGMVLGFLQHTIFLSSLWNILCGYKNMNVKFGSHSKNNVKILKIQFEYNHLYICSITKEWDYIHRRIVIFQIILSATTPKFPNATNKRYKKWCINTNICTHWIIHTNMWLCVKFHTLHETYHYAIGLQLNICKIHIPAYKRLYSMKSTYSTTTHHKYNSIC